MESTSVKKTSPKKIARPIDAEKQQVPPSREQEPLQTSTKTFQKKEIGKANFELKEVPNEIKQTAQNRFGRPGVEMLMTSARGNGSYKGEILNSDHYLVQRVGENSVVFHKKSNVEFASEQHKWADTNKKLNGAELAIHYDGDKGKAFPYDQERENLARMVNTMKKTADGLKLPTADLESFKKTIDQVQNAMWENLKERRKQPAKDKPEPEQQKPQERSR